MGCLVTHCTVCRHTVLLEGVLSCKVLYFFTEVVAKLLLLLEEVVAKSLLL